MQTVESFTGSTGTELAIKIKNYLKKYPNYKISNMTMSEVLGYGNSMTVLVCFEV